MEYIYICYTFWAISLAVSKLFNNNDCLKHCSKLIKVEETPIQESGNLVLRYKSLEGYRE